MSSSRSDCPVTPPRRGVKRKATSLLQCVNSILQCPICFDFVSRPIYQCHNGHTACKSCYARIKVDCATRKICPTCREPVKKPIRNLALERLSDAHETPCNHSDGGCDQRVTGKTREKHEQECSFRPFLCPLAADLKYDCTWHGSLHDLAQHLNNEHTPICDEKPLVRPAAPSCHIWTLKFENRGNEDWWELVECEGWLFLVMCQHVQEEGLKICVRTCDKSSDKPNLSFDFKMSLLPPPSDTSQTNTDGRKHHSQIRRRVVRGPVCPVRDSTQLCAQDALFVCSTDDVTDFVCSNVPFFDQRCTCLMFRVAISAQQPAADTDMMAKMSDSAKASGLKPRNLRDDMQLS